MNFSGLNIDKTWSLFLDRDGVINQKLPGDYVRSWAQFVFANGVLEALPVFASIFGRIVMVTNQQGVGKGLMSSSDLDDLHKKMLSEILSSGGRIDAIYHSPHLEKENHHSRKPNVGMGLMAKKDYPEISFKKSIMVGDSPGDMLFGKRLGMKTVFIGNFPAHFNGLHQVDWRYDDLITFARDIKNQP
ncbi:MAG: HAD-IIIA family hydrolase [Lentimicrobium sp.]|jgi:histidinol-phosphate phosphatase family protein|nr:HAD-IIIA family hydrolase [Lentimicrobium sp.]MDD2529255.1 HAD-IIIA family hydrolase [Lentimicrobiaceae bacterium]MDD4598570.1 HAD-IIIA family hydrolase [Lentimicrobiaceae bacterium]MDY0024762.1 HAD-IIIA family hydrolase [Lentimicrobium sp.]